MTLPLEWEDYVVEPGEEPGVWIEVTLRALVPRDELAHKGAKAAVFSSTPGAWTRDMVRSSQVGLPAECECGKVAVRFGLADGGEAFYPFGFDRYGGSERTLRVEGQYCPSCDGDEDKG